MPDNDFLAGIRRENMMEFAPEKDEQETETPAESPSEKEPKDEESGSQPEAQEGKDDTPPAEAKPSEEEEPAVFEAFHKHPRWQSLQKELKDLSQFKEQTMPLLEKIATSLESNQDTIPPMPDSFKDAFGENQALWEKQYRYEKQREDRLLSAVRQELQTAIQAPTREEKKWNEWVDNSVAELEAEGLKFNRNELMKVAVDYQPTDKEGNISLRKAYDILQLKKSQTTPASKPAEKKKEIAGKTMGGKEGTTEVKDYKTWGEMRHRSFADISLSEEVEE